MKIELCVASIEALIAAKKLGVDRIELCVNLEQGGLTPSMGFVQKAKELGLETHVLIRPRCGGFNYNEHEIEIILADVLEFQRLDVDGLVLGLLTDTMRLNRSVLEHIRAQFKKSLTFHRAFDDLVEWEKELQWLADIGFNRILSSGLSTVIAHGIPLLASMKKMAQGRIEIMPGGGINLANLPLIIEHVLPDAVHFSATSKQSLDPESMFSEEVLIFDENKAKRLIEMCRNFS